MDELSSRFLTSFNAIHDWLNHKAHTQDVEFVRLLSQLERSDSSIRRHISELKRFAKLRNLIAHSHSHIKPLAVPTAISVERLEAISKQLLSPPLLRNFAASPVEVCSPSDPLGYCVRKMHEGIFSQLPVYEGQKFIGLLTAETIARWLATFFLGKGDGIVEERPVFEVMQHQEHSDNYKFMRANTTVPNALSAFEDYQHRGRRLEAILITNLGHTTETLTGIVTINDIPTLNGAMSS